MGGDILRRKRPEDPFADQLEWLDHRYDPGYFLGGTLRPELRLSLGAHAKRGAALLAFGSGLGIIGLMILLSLVGGFVPEPISWGSGVLSLLVGKKMWAAANTDGPLDISTEKQRLYRLTEMAGLATALACFGLVATLVLIASVTAIMKGHMAIAASVAILFALAALRRRGELQ